MSCFRYNVSFADLSRCIIAGIGYNDKFDRMAEVNIKLI